MTLQEIHDYLLRNEFESDPTFEEKWNKLPFLKYLNRVEQVYPIGANDVISNSLTYNDLKSKLVSPYDTIILYNNKTVLELYQEKDNALELIIEDLKSGTTSSISKPVLRTYKK